MARRRTPLLLLLGVTGTRAADRLREHRQPAARARGDRAPTRWQSGCRLGATRMQLVTPAPRSNRVCSRSSAARAGLLVARWTRRFHCIRPSATNAAATSCPRRSDSNVLLFAAAADGRHWRCCSASSPRLHSTRPDLASTLKGAGRATVRRAISCRDSARRWRRLRSRCR